MEQRELESAEARRSTLARVVITGAAGAVEQLTYAIPPALNGLVAPGQRVLVPMRSRRLTGIVIEIGEKIDAGGAVPRPILEILDARPLFDRAHLELIEFLASYYMAPLGEAYRNVIPAAARVESRRMLRLGLPPGPLALAAFTPLERAIMQALAKRPMTPRQLRGSANCAEFGDHRDVEAALARLTSDRLVDSGDATRGRHRERVAPIVRLIPGSEPIKLRGRKQREIIQRLSVAGASGIRLDQLEDDIPGVKVALRAMVQRGAIELAAPHSTVEAAATVTSSDPAIAANIGQGPQPVPGQQLRSS